MEKEAAKENEIEKEEVVEGSVKETKKKEKSGVKKDAAAPNAGWANKIFRRKSGM
jgi:hypothetical protein